MWVGSHKDWECIGPLVEHMYDLDQSDFDHTIQEYLYIVWFAPNIS